MQTKSTAQKRLNILLVEDNLTHARLVQRTLATHDIPNEIHHVTDGEAALDYLQHRGSYSHPLTSPRPDLILLDIRLPKIDGHEVLQSIKSSDTLKEIPVVILTTSQEERDVRRAYRHHANSYLVKPVAFDNFRRLMQDLGTYWLDRNQNPNAFE